MVLTAHKVINCWSFKECLFCPANDIQKLRVSKILTDFFLITITKNVATFLIHVYQKMVFGNITFFLVNMNFDAVTSKWTFTKMPCWKTTVLSTAQMWSKAYSMQLVCSLLERDYAKVCFKPTKRVQQFLTYAHNGGFYISAVHWSRSFHCCT